MVPRERRERDPARGRAKRQAAAEGGDGSGATLLYFSFSTLTTVGYGDITPLHPMARNIANFEAVLGQLYPATLLARLVSLEISYRRPSKND